MDKEDSSWPLSRGVQYLNVSKGVTYEVGLWHELLKRGIMRFVCWQAIEFHLEL